VLDKAVGVLRATAEGPCGLAELCERTGLPRATAHRLAVGLEAHGMLLRTPDGRWHPGPTLGQLAAGGRTRCSTPRPPSCPGCATSPARASSSTGATGSTAICIAHAEPPSGLRDTVPVGSRLPMTAGSGAKVLAAWCDPATQRLVLADASFSERVLVDVRRRGWAQSVAEREAGVASVSAPVRDAAGQVVAAVSVSGPVDRIGRRPGVRWAADLLAAADALQHRL
jgi:DNA-binding IclR family transcriptional regulator